MEDVRLTAFKRLLDIMDELRVKCPWDRGQTFDSLRTMTIEETYELSDAIMGKDMNEIRKELGDILLHIVFYAKLGDEAGAFDITAIINSLCDKLVYRHPHVFAEIEVQNADEVVQNWEQLKVKEKDGNKTILSGVPDSLSALIKASRIQEKAAAVGFDWEKREQVWDKFKEECNELSTEIDKMDKERMENEFGDVFFSLVNASRLYGIDPETALEWTNRKFIYRFTYLEQKTIRQGRSLKDMSLAEMDEIWNEAKQTERNAK
ncbi:MAG: nucleoside triphosphate pyrophosphohydrolase [Prevotellaceae bacterium]|jgi:XTP/dITP diphosphohydrolase|nr:nucleoside triphosphate pyrophosphohydrolase [Prevotellaceae bacterium]